MICRELQECRADEIYNCKNKKRCVIYSWKWVLGEDWFCCQR